MHHMKAEVRLFFYRALPMILMQSVISFNIYQQYNLSRCEEIFFVLFLLLNSSSLMCMAVMLSIGPVTERYARHVGSIYRALTNWVAINASGYISFYIKAHSPKGILQFDYNYSENELKAVICSSMFILMSFMSFCPGLDLNIPNALASVGVFMSLVLDSAPAQEDYYYHGYRIRYPMYACVSVYSLIQSLFKYYVPSKSHELPTAAVAVAIYSFANSPGPSLPGFAWTALLIILFGVLLNGR